MRISIEGRGGEIVNKIMCILIILLAVALVIIGRIIESYMR